LINDRIMKQQETSGFRYKLVAFPGGQLAKKLMEEKRAFNRSFQDQQAVVQEPEVVLAEFHAKDEMEDTLIRWLQRITAELKSFDICFNNYSGVPAHTVFLRILDHEPFRQLADQLQPIDYYVRSNDCPPVKYMLHPYLPISGKLARGVYETALRIYSQKEFTDSFEVNELMLLRDGPEEHSGTRRAVLRLLPAGERSVNN